VRPKIFSSVAVDHLSLSSKPKKVTVTRREKKRRAIYMRRRRAEAYL